MVIVRAVFLGEKLGNLVCKIAFSVYFKSVFLSMLLMLLNVKYGSEIVHYCEVALQKGA